MQPYHQWGNLLHKTKRDGHKLLCRNALLYSATLKPFPLSAHPVLFYCTSALQLPVWGRFAHPKSCLQSLHEYLALAQLHSKIHKNNSSATNSSTCCSEDLRGICCAILVSVEPVLLEDLRCESTVCLVKYGLSYRLFLYKDNMYAYYPLHLPTVSEDSQNAFDIGARFEMGGICKCDPASHLPEGLPA